MTCMDAYTPAAWDTAHPAARTPAEPGDDTLLASLATGDPQAFAQFYDRHAAAAYTVALGLLHDPHTAQDLVQETFLAIWQHGASFDQQRGQARTWVLAIVRHRALDLLRSAWYKRQLLDGHEQLPAVQDRVEVEGEALRRHDRAHLLAALAALPPPKRQAVELAYFGGYSYPEIATILGLPLPTVKSRLRLALQKLRAMPGVHSLAAAG